MPITALLFDADGTLKHPNFKRVARELRAQAVPARALQAAEVHVRRAMDAGEIVTANDDEEPWLRYLRTVIRRCGVFPSTETMARLRRYHLEHNLWDRIDRSLPQLLERLAGRFRLGVVSSSKGREREDLARLGLSRWFEVIVDAGEDGAAKPDPRIFARALQQMAVKPEEAAYVGDAYHEDVIGARAAGMLPILFDPNRLYGDKPCMKIHALEELLDGRLESTSTRDDARTETGLIAAVLAAPDDDGPRLVYADWLAERGDPRGELIAIQCALSKLPPNASPRRAELVSRESALLEAHGRAWTAVLGIPHAATGRDAWTCELRRGFVEVVKRGAGTFVDLGDRIFRETPVRELYAPAAYATRICELIDGSRLHTLVLEGASDASALAELLASPHLRHLERLELLSTEAADGAVRLGAHLGGLRALKIQQSGLDDGAVVRLFSTLRLSRLTTLSLVGNRIRARGAEALLGDALPELEELDLTDNLLGDAGAEAIARSAMPPRLVKLGLGCNNIGSRGAAALAASTSLARVRQLALGGNLIDDPARAHLIDRLGKSVLC